MLTYAPLPEHPRIATAYCGIIAQEAAMSRIFSALSGRARMVQWRVLNRVSAPLNYPFDAIRRQDLPRGWRGRRGNTHRAGSRSASPLVSAAERPMAGRPRPGG